VDTERKWRCHRRPYLPLDFRRPLVVTVRPMDFLNRLRIHLPVIITLTAFLGIAAPPPANAQSSGPADASTGLHYPPATRAPTVDDYFGVQVPTPYQWMENLDSPDVNQWVQDENALTYSYLDKIPIRTWIKTKLTSLWNYARESTPEQVAGGRIFFARNSGLQNQSVVYVQDSPDTTPRELLDPNVLSPNGSLALMDWQPFRKAARIGTRYTCETSPAAKTFPTSFNG
jgi:hypothetical protein